MNELAKQEHPKVTIISKTEIIMDAFLASVDPYALADIDQCPVRFSKTARYLAAMMQRHDPVDSLRNLKPQIMKTIHYTFAVSADRDTLLNFQSEASITVVHVDPGYVNQHTILATGPLLDWVNTIINSAVERNTFGHRFIVNFIQLYLQRAEGLALLFDKYRQVLQPDRTFILEPK